MARERDVTLRITTESDGGQNLKALVAQLDALAAKGGDAAPEMQRLAAEITRLEKAQAAANALEKVATATTELALRLGGAEQNTRELATNLEAARQATERFAAEEQSAKAALDGTKAQLKEQQAALKALSAEKRQAGANTDQLAQRELELKAAITAAKAAVEAQVAAYKQAQGAANNAVTAQSALSAEYRASEASIKQLTSALDKQQVKLAAAGNAAKEAGVDADRLASEQGRLATELQLSAQYAKYLEDELQRVAAAEKLVAQQNADEELRQQAIAAQKAAEYTNALADALNRAEQEAKQLKQLALDEETRQQAIAAQKAAEYTNWWADALNKAEIEAKQVAATTKMLGSTLENSFGKAGVRSANQLQAEINQINQALQRLGASTKVSGADFERAWASGQSRINALRNELNGLEAPIQKTSFLTGAIGRGFAALTAAVASLDIGRAFIKANVELENTTRALKAITGSTASANAEMRFIRQSADRLGVSVIDLADSYKGLLAASKGTSLEGARTREIFQSVSNALAQTGASSYATSRAFTAITQMVSKGVVSMEEMRQQLAEALPGAFQAAARGAGLTEQELMKLIASGDLLTSDFLPALAKGLDDTFGNAPAKVQGLQQSWERLKQSFADASTLRGEGGVSGVLGKFLDSISAKLNTATDGFVLFGRVIESIKAKFADDSPIKKFYNTLANIPTGPFEATSKLVTAFIAKWKADSDKARDASEQVAGAAQKQGAAVLAAGQAAGTAATEQNKLATATGQVTTALQAAQQPWLQQQQIYAKASEQAAEYARLKEKEVEARKIEGQTISAVAALLGNEASVLQANTQAKEGEAVALKALLAARTTELAITEQQIASYQQRLATEQTLSAQDLEALRNLREKAAAQTAVLDKSRQMAAQSEIDVLRARITSQTYLDNSARLTEYKNAMDQATAGLSRLEMQHITGQATQQQVDAGRRTAAEAVALYRDALNDSVAAAKRAGDLSMALADMAGSEAEKRVAAAEAAKVNAEAIDQVTASRKADVTAIQEQITLLERHKEVVGSLSPEMEKYLGELRQKLALSQQEASVSERQTLAAKLEAEQTRVRAEAYKDNSSRLLEYKAASEAAEARVRSLTAAHAQGKATEAELNAARVQAAGALALYRDALNDAAAAAQRKIDVVQRDANLTRAVLDLEMERARTALKVAEANGDERAAIEAKVRMKEIEIKIARANMEAAALESRAIMAKAEADLKELEATDANNAAKRAEIEARIAAAKVKALESERGAELIKQLEREAQAIREVTRAKTTDNATSRSSGTSSSSFSGGSGGGSGGGGGGDAPTVPGGGSSTVGVYSGLITDYEDIARRRGLTGDQIQAFAKLAKELADEYTSQAYKGVSAGAHSLGFDPGVGAFKRALIDAETQVKQKVNGRGTSRMGPDPMAQDDTQYNVDFEAMMYARGLSIEQVKAAMQFINDIWKQLITTRKPVGAYAINKTVNDAIDMALSKANSSGSSGGSVPATASTPAAMQPSTPVSQASAPAAAAGGVSIQIGTLSLSMNGSESVSDLINTLTERASRT